MSIMKKISSAIHPKTGIEYFIGEWVCIYQGRFGHNNIIKIESIWQKPDGVILVSETESLPGTYLSAIKDKIMLKVIKSINRTQKIK